MLDGGRSVGTSDAASLAHSFAAYHESGDHPLRDERDPRVGGAGGASTYAGEGFWEHLGADAMSDAELDSVMIGGGGDKLARQRAASTMESELGRRYERSRFANHYLGFSMAIDFTIVLISIQEYWLSLGGSSAFYGFVFGCYDLSQVLGSPIFGRLTDRYGERPVIIFSVLANILGNALYSLSYAAGTPYLILIGRLIAGLGSSSLTIGLAFIARTVCPPKFTPADQINEIADYKLYQSGARVLGPIIGFLLTTMPDPSLSQPLTDRVFNYFTVPGWIAVANGIFIMLPLAIWRQENSTLGMPSHLLPQTKKAAQPLSFRDRLVHHCIFWTVVQFLGSFLYWSIGSNLFAIAFAEYRMLSSKTDSWKLYVGGTIGFLTGFSSYKYLNRKKPGAPPPPTTGPAAAKTTINYYQTGGLLMFAVGHFILFDWAGDETSSAPNHNPFKFYAGVLVGTMGTAWFFSASNTYLSWFLKTPAFRAQSAPHMAYLIGLNTGAGSLGRFVGPTFFAAVAPISDLPGEQCVASNPQHYIASGCYLKNADEVIGSLAGMALFTCLSCYLYHAWTSPAFGDAPGTSSQASMKVRLLDTPHQTDAVLKPAAAAAAANGGAANVGGGKAVEALQTMSPSTASVESGRQHDDFNSSQSVVALPPNP